jgi:hypothetical protein
MAKSLSERANEKLRETDDENIDSNYLPVSISAGAFPHNPDMGPSIPGHLARVGGEYADKKGKLNLGATGINVDTPVGQINKIGGIDATYEHPSGFYGKIIKPLNSPMQPRYEVGYKTEFNQGGSVKSKSNSAKPKVAGKLATRGYGKARK